MPADELLRRMEALNGRPLENVPDATARLADAGSPGSRAGISIEMKLVRDRSLAAGETCSLAERLPGLVCAAGPGEHYAVVRHLASCVSWSEALCARLQSTLQNERFRGKPNRLKAVFLDLETLGLRGQPLFLIGLLIVGEDGELECRQLLARSLDEESSAIAACAGVLAQSDLLVSFNGDAFDWPTLALRASRLSMPLSRPKLHVDVIHPSRLRYGRSVRNCRLKTLERAVCGRTRRGDVEGGAIPGIYREFMRTGDARGIAAIAHHNLLDLVTTAELLTHLWP